MATKYPAAIQAECFGESYSEYIQQKLEEYVTLGIHTEEYAQTANLGDLFAGNDGD